jgi:CIC family chloride channel protein
MDPTLAAAHMEPPASFNARNVLYLSVLAVGNAVVISIVAKGLLLLINLITNISFYGKFSIEEATPLHNQLGWLVVLVPVLGALVIGVMARYGSSAIRGHGIPEAMEQILVNKSRIKPIITFLKPLSAAISIGTGGPFGSEGPIIATGGAFGSFIGQLLRITATERKILLAAGAAAGMSCIFGSPLAAVILAIELLLFEYSPRSIIPAILGCITAAAFHHWFWGGAPVFTLPDVPVSGNQALLMYSVIGIVIGLLAALITKAVYAIEDGFEKIPIHWMWWPALGSIVVGLVGYYAPETLGVGYYNINNLLSASVTLHMLFVLSVMKFISWAFSLGSGTSGGTLAPLLTMGGACGIFVAMVLQAIFPSIVINPSVAALVGMAAMFAGAARALLTSIIFALETTGNANTLLPLVCACVASYFISFFLMKNTIMTEKIARRGILTPHTYKPDLLESVLVKEAMMPDIIMVSEENTIGELRQWMYESKLGTYTLAYPVVSANEELVGIVKTEDVMDPASPAQAAVSYITSTNGVVVSEENTLRHAVDMMAGHQQDILPVVATDNYKQLLGVLNYRSVFAAYRHVKEGEETATRNISIKRQVIKLLIRNGIVNKHEA